MRSFAYLTVLLLLPVFAPVASAQTVPVDLDLVIVTTAITAPIAIRAPNDNSGRVFVASQTGTIRIIKDGVLLATPFLTVPVSYTAGAESGVLSFEFHPNFGRAGLPHNDEFYVGYIRPNADPRLGAAPDNVLVRYTVSANPDIANPTGTQVLRLADNTAYHSSLDLHFGPDGLLHMATGDGGTQNGVHGFAECLWKKAADNNPASCGTSAATYFMMGKLLRIDVDNRGGIATSEMCGTTTGQPAEYSIPAGNPHVGTTSTCDEIWLSGFRNPWRFSFDRLTGDLWIADVGQGTREEVDLRVNGSTESTFYGWHCMEGSTVYNTSNICNPAPASVLPVMEYATGANSRCAITGGYRFRGPVQPLQGMYVFADSCSSEIFMGLRSGAGMWSSTVWRNDANGYGTYSAFGEDQASNLYVANTVGNTVYRFASERIFADGTDGG